MPRWLKILLAVFVLGWLYWAFVREHNTVFSFKMRIDEDPQVIYNYLSDPRHLMDIGYLSKVHHYHKLKVPTSSKNVGEEPERFTYIGHQNVPGMPFPLELQTNLSLFHGQRKIVTQANTNVGSFGIHVWTFEKRTDEEEVYTYWREYYRLQMCWAFTKLSFADNTINTTHKAFQEKAKTIIESMKS